MEKVKRILSIIISLMFFIYPILCFFNTSHAVTQSFSSDIEKIDEAKYPGIKSQIKSLIQKYPNWTIKVCYTNLDWNQVIANEYVGHGTSPRNLIHSTLNYTGEWICSICGNRAYDNGSLYCASEQAIKYMMDPRNSLNENDIFQFEELTNNGYEISTIAQMLKGTFLEGHENGIINAADKNNVNPYYIVARIIQEQGKNGTVLTKGNGYNGQYIGYYNVFNIGASGNSTEKILLNGLAYARKKRLDNSRCFY